MFSTQVALGLVPSSARGRQPIERRRLRNSAFCCVRYLRAGVPSHAVTKLKPPVRGRGYEARVFHATARALSFSTKCFPQIRPSVCNARGVLARKNLVPAVIGMPTARTQELRNRNTAGLGLPWYNFPVHEIYELKFEFSEKGAASSFGSKPIRSSAFANCFLKPHKEH